MDDILGKQLTVDFIANPVLLLILLAVSVLIGIMAGMYPAFVISSFQPVTVLRGDFHKSKIGAAIRKGLVLVQFAVTIFLITGVLVIMDQIDYLKSMDMGYNRDQVITMFTPNNQRDLLKARVAALPGVKTVGRSSGVLGSDFIRYEVIPEGFTRDNSQMFLQIAADESFFETLEVEMAEGRSFSPDFPSDTTEAVLVNETAVKKAGWDEPLGKRLEMVEIDGSITAKRVVGVVKDFHFTSARQEIEPLFFQFNTQNTFLFLVKLEAGSFQETIADIEEVYKEIYPNNNFNYQFLDDQFDQQFQNDREFATNIAYFSGFAIFIACLGLLGLVAFAVDQRKAEIAVRKVLGSSEVTIIYLLAKDFLQWVIIANIIAWPLAYYAIGLWLDEFVYKVALSPLPFIVSGLAALLIAFLTMLYQSVKASYANPVDSLRNE
jgi:putative ABC transport system permease protein